jgi:hypothetical protein
VHRILGRFPIDGWIIKSPGSLSLSVHPYPARGAYERDATTLAPPRVATDWHAHTDPAGRPVSGGSLLCYRHACTRGTVVRLLPVRLCLVVPASATCHHRTIRIVMTDASLTCHANTVIRYHAYLLSSLISELIMLSLVSLSSVCSKSNLARESSSQLHKQ